MDRLAQVCERIASYALAARKRAIFDEYLSTLPEDDHARVLRLLSPGPPLKLGSTTLRKACQALVRWDPEVLQTCYDQVGDTVETVCLLMEGVSRQEPLTLLQAERIYMDLFLARTTVAKVGILTDLLLTHRPQTLKYYLKAITGKLRIGLGLEENPAVIAAEIAPSRSTTGPTLSVVITSAEQGRGRLATVLSEYTIAVRSGDGFVNVGKVSAGLPDREIRQLTRLLRKSTLERFGRVAVVQPEIVLEVSVEGIEKSPRRKGGYACIAPRILLWQREKSVLEAADLESIEALFRTPPS